MNKIWLQIRRLPDVKRPCNRITDVSLMGTFSWKSQAETSTKIKVRKPKFLDELFLKNIENS